MRARALLVMDPTRQVPLRHFRRNLDNRLTAVRVELSNTLKPISAEARSESSQATSDAALLIKSLGSMIEPELKPAPAGLEALGKVIALRTGKSSVADWRATVAETATGRRDSD